MTKTTKSTGDLISPSSTSSLSVKSTISSDSRRLLYSQKINNATRRHTVRNNFGGGGSLRNRQPIKHLQRPPLSNATNKTNNLQREYKIRQSQTLLLLATAIISFVLFLLFTLPFYALVGLTIMTTFLGLGIVVATSALKTRYLLELEHPLGLLRYLPPKVRVPLTEKSLHDCLISPSQSFGSLKSLAGGGNNSSNNSSKNSLSSMSTNNNNNSSMNSLASYSSNKNNNNNSSSTTLSMMSQRRVSSRNSLQHPPSPPSPARDDDDDDIKNCRSEFSSSGFDLMRQSTIKRKNNNKTMLNQPQRQQQEQNEEEEEEDGGIGIISDERKRKGRLVSDRYSIYQTNQRVIR